MAVLLYFDVHVPKSITEQLQRRLVDVLTSQQDNTTLLSDEDLLDRARSLGRLLFTQDIRFEAMAAAWQRQNRPFSGLVFGHQQGASIGQYVRDLELIAKASDLTDWENQIIRLPFK